jgi:hypothetical protein
MQRRLEAERPGIGGNVVHAAVGDQETAGDAIDRHVRQCRGKCAKQFCSIGLAVGLAGLDDAHFQPLHLFQGIDEGFLRLRSFLRALAEVLARALVDHDGGDRGQRLAVLAGKGRVRQSEQHQRQRKHANGSAARAAEQEQPADHHDRSERDPEHDGRHERGERDTVLHGATVPAVRSAPARAPGRLCSCRSTCT